VHGSAPDIAGTGRANPLGQVWAGAMMLDHLGHAAAADAVMTTVGRVLSETHVRTPDLNGAASTAEVEQELLHVFETIDHPTRMDHLQ
jgi:tartrate dehydrogenase/decarboxylase/D-malate dehydrogenase